MLPRDDLILDCEVVLFRRSVVLGLEIAVFRYVVLLVWKTVLFRYIELDNVLLGDAVLRGEAVLNAILVLPCRLVMLGVDEVVEAAADMGELLNAAVAKTRQEHPELAAEGDPKQLSRNKGRSVD